MVGRRAQLVDSDQFVVPSIPEFTNKGFFRPLSCILSVKLMEHKETTGRVLVDQRKQPSHGVFKSKRHNKETSGSTDSVKSNRWWKGTIKDYDAKERKFLVQYDFPSKDGEANYWEALLPVKANKMPQWRFLKQKKK